MKGLALTYLHWLSPHFSQVTPCPDSLSIYLGFFIPIQADISMPSYFSPFLAQSAVPYALFCTLILCCTVGFRAVCVSVCGDPLLSFSQLHHSPLEGHIIVHFTQSPVDGHFVHDHQQTAVNILVPPLFLSVW